MSPSPGCPNSTGIGPACSPPPKWPRSPGVPGVGCATARSARPRSVPPLEDELVRAVENHSFQPLEQIFWRNSQLDFSHIDALLASLQTPSHLQGLVRGNDAADLETLGHLAREPEIRSLARGRSRLKLLWEACQVPDFRKISDDSHTRLCARIFGHIANDGKLPTDWIAGQIAALARADGDIDTLMQRLASMRVWSYIAARADWVPDAAHWQGRARAVEDLLSDALHERLTARFVDRRAAHLMRKLEAGDGDELLSAVTRRGEVVVEGHPVGHVEGFEFVPDPSSVGDERRLVMRAARRALITEMPLRVSRLEAAADSAFAWLPSQRIAWEGAPVARLRAGASVIRPLVEISGSEFLDGPQRERVRLRLQRFLDQHIHDALTPLFTASAMAERDGALRGPLHRLIEGLGVVPGATEAEIPPALRARLKGLDVRAGRFSLFLPALLKPRARMVRAALWALQHNLPVPELPQPGAVSVPPPDWPHGFAEGIGWVDCGPVLLRLDIAERIAAEFAFAARGRPVPVPPDLSQRLSVKPDALPVVLRALGLRVNPAIALAENEYGPPPPATLSPIRRKPADAAPLPAGPTREGPFAALAAWHR